jgi:hypothetical protein
VSYLLQSQDVWQPQRRGGAAIFQKKQTLHNQHYMPRNADSQQVLKYRIFLPHSYFTHSFFCYQATAYRWQL